MMADKEEKKDVGAKEEKRAKKGKGGIIKILVIVVVFLKRLDGLIASHIIPILDIRNNNPTAFALSENRL